MSDRFLASLGGVAVVAWLGLAPVAGGQALASTAKRTSAAVATWQTPWGDPDLQGIWTNHHGVPLERPSALAGKAALTDQEVAALEAETTRNRDRATPGQVGTYNSFWSERGKRSKQTSLIVDPPDGKLPIRPEVKKMVDAKVAAKRSPTYLTVSWEDRDAYERCVSRGMPGAMLPGFYNHNYQILQTPGYVVIHVEMIHDARIIPLDGRPELPQSVRQWMGDSRGHWEGNTLVVETAHFNGKVWMSQNLAFGLADGGRVIERFTRVDADTIDYQFTVDDPATFTGPFTVLSPMEKIQEGIFEYACHEGNYGMQDILAGARAQEKAAADAARKESSR